MGNDYDVFKTIDLDGLLLQLEDDIDKLYKEYRFLNMEKNAFNELLIQSVKDSYSSYDESIEVDYITYFNDKMVDSIKSYLISIQDTDKIIIVINNYINSKLKKVDTSTKAINGLKKLSLFLSDNELVITPDKINELLNNSIINTYMLLIVKENLKMIQDGSYVDAYEEPLILSLIELFAANNNIEIKSLDDFDDNDNDVNDEYFYEDIEKQIIHDINRIKMLTPEEEQELGYRILEGDQKAINKLTEHNMRLVKVIAKRFLGRGLPFADLIQEGNVGLLRAARKFDVRKGYKFSTFASWWVRQSMTRAIHDTGRTIRLPVHIMYCIGIFHRIVVQLTNEYGREPTINELSKYTGMDEETVEYLIRISSATLSLNSRISDNEEAELFEVIPDEDYSVDDEVIFINLRRDLFDSFDIANIPDREKYIILSRFGLLTNQDEKTQEELGLELGLTRERVRQIEKEVLNKIRKNKRTKNKLKAYLDGLVGDKESISSDESKKVYFNNPINEGYVNDLRLLEDFTIEKKRAPYRSSKKKPVNHKVVKSRIKVTRTSKDVLKENEKKRVVKTKKAFKRLTNIYTYYDYSKEDIDSAIAELDNEYREILFKKFGGNLEEPVLTQLNKEENALLYQRILPKIPRIINKMKKKKLL